jgi:hypothetical protein
MPAPTIPIVVMKSSLRGRIRDDARGAQIHYHSRRSRAADLSAYRRRRGRDQKEPLGFFRDRREGAMSERLGAMRAEIEEAVLGTPGESGPAERRQAMEGEGATPELAAFLRRVQQHAYRITDDEVAALRAAGHGDDQIFELLLSAALGAAEARLSAGLRALKGGAGAAAQGR